MAKNWLLEIGTEEIPARFMPDALRQLGNLAEAELKEARITYDHLKTLGTPRRLVLTVSGASEMQEDRTTRKKGPSLKVAYDAAGKPTKALEGFARGAGVAVDSLEKDDTYVYAIIHEVGRPVQEILPAFFLKLIDSLNFPKTMRWGDLDVRFARPIHWIIALCGQGVVSFEKAGIASGRKGRGHRVLGSGEFEVSSVEDYFVKMKENFVIVDPEERRKLIREQVEKLAKEQGGTATIDEDLLEEVLYLVEYPTALCGRFEEKYLDLPSEAIITPMREHQRYFPVFGKDGKLLPVFITVRNGGKVNIEGIQHGNERVLRARLSDARFFFDEDRKLPLGDRLEKLKSIVFQEGLGTMYHKVLRLKKMAVANAKLLGATAEEIVWTERGAELAKADLVTGMVCEFTELQGIMGREYAKMSGEKPAVAEAIFEHYLPRFAGDELPQSVAGRATAIADKMDNIITTFSRGLIPTGSQDPYALRRQALGIVNILIDAKAHFSVGWLTTEAMNLIGINDEAKKAEILANVQEFFRLRLRNVLTDEGISYDVLDALLAVDTDDIYDVWLRARAMASEAGMNAMQKAVEAFTRASNLAKNATTEQVDESLFSTEAERGLYAAWKKSRTEIDRLSAAKDYTGVLMVMAELTAPISAFFSEVLVMVDDEKVKANRLALLKAISGLASHMADLSKIVVL